MLPGESLVIFSAKILRNSRFLDNEICTRSLLFTLELYNWSSVTDMFEDYSIFKARLNKNLQLMKTIDFRIESLELSRVRNELDNPGAKF